MANTSLSNPGLWLARLQALPKQVQDAIDRVVEREIERAEREQSTVYPKRNARLQKALAPSYLRVVAGTERRG